MARASHRIRGAGQRLITMSEAAARASNSPAWWRKIAARQQIAVVKLGRSTRLYEEDVNRIIAEGFHPERVPSPRKSELPVMGGAAHGRLPVDRS